MWCSWQAIAKKLQKQKEILLPYIAKNIPYNVLKINNN